MKPTMTIREAAEIIPCGLNQAYAAAKRGEIPTIRIGKRFLVLREPFLRMLRVPPPDAARPEPDVIIETQRPKIDIVVAGAVIPGSVEVDGALLPAAEAEIGGRTFALVEIEQRYCPHCQRPFQVGRYSMPPRRLDALFCCEEHRVRHNSLQRSQ